LEVILSANEKGGSCKTADALLLTTCLNALGYRVLVLDLDPSGNFSQAALPVIPNTVLYDVLNFTIAPEDAVHHGPICDIIPTKRDNTPAVTPATIASKGFELGVPGLSWPCPQGRLPRCIKDESGAYIFRKNGDKFFCCEMTENGPQVQEKTFRMEMLSDPAFMEQIGKTVFFDEYSLQSR
jgi:hypothetical protein